MSPIEVRPNSLILGAHNWRRLWEHPTKSWFDRDSRTGKCLKDIREVTPRADPWDLLGDPHGGNEDIKDVKIGSASERRNSLASERGYIKHAERYQTPRGMENSRKEIRWWSGCADW